MLPDAWREKAYTTALRFVGKKLLPELYKEFRQAETEAHADKVFAERLAAAAADKAVQDPAVLQREMERRFGDAYDRQLNLETIVREATDHISETISDGDCPPEEDIEDDWRRKFTSFAEDVSNPDMQQVWARILAGEIKKPGQFSYRTLRLVSELSTKEAALVEEMSRYSFNGDAIATFEKEWQQGQLFLKAKQFQDLGFTLDSPGESARRFIESGTDYYLPSGDLLGLLKLPAKAENTPQIPIMLLTQAGKELLPILPKPDPRIRLREILEHIREEASDRLGALPPKCGMILKKMPGGHFADSIVFGDPR